MRVALALTFALACPLVACSDDPTVADTGPADLGVVDSGARDLGVTDLGILDAGGVDASPDGGPDLGFADAGEADGALEDAGEAPGDADLSDADLLDAELSDVDLPDVEVDGGLIPDSGVEPDSGLEPDTGLAEDAGPRECGVLYATERASVDSTGLEANGRSYGGSLSDDGRYLAFESAAGNLVANGTTFYGHIFIRDRILGTTVRVSIDAQGNPGVGFSGAPVITPDGRYVTFTSDATNLVASPSLPGTNQVFLRDLQTGTNELISRSTAGASAIAMSGHGRPSADGRYVVFPSFDATLVPGDTNGVRDVFVRDRQAGTTERVSLSTGGAEGDLPAGPAAISGDGRYVAFTSIATNLVPNDSNGANDVFLRDRQAGTTIRISDPGAGGKSPSITPDGRFVVYETSNQVYVWDAQVGTPELASVTTNGGAGGGISRNSAISADGRFVVFESLASNLVPGDQNGTVDVFVRDRLAGTTRRLSLDTNGADPDGFSITPSVSGDGRTAVFESVATDLIPNDSNGFNDVFVVPTDPSCP